MLQSKTALDGSVLKKLRKLFTLPVIAIMLLFAVVLICLTTISPLIKCKSISVFLKSRNELESSLGLDESISFLKNPSKVQWSNRVGEMSSDALVTENEIFASGKYKYFILPDRTAWTCCKGFDNS